MKNNHNNNSNNNRRRKNERKILCAFAREKSEKQSSHSLIKAKLGGEINFEGEKTQRKMCTGKIGQNQQSYSKRKRQKKTERNLKRGNEIMSSLEL